jgi:hypothetical protein
MPPPGPPPRARSLQPQSSDYHTRAAQTRTVPTNLQVKRSNAVRGHDEDYVRGNAAVAALPGFYGRGR